MRLCLLVEKNSVRCGYLCNERARLAPISVTTELKLPKSGGRGGGGGGWYQYVT